MGQGAGPHLIAAFPLLAQTFCRLTSPATVDYNCIAWAAGDTERWWWPRPPYYWPAGARRDESIDAFLEAYATCGFSRCDSDRFEDGFVKIAIYAGHDGRVKHAARSVSAGRWTSKLGALEDIEHELEALSGPAYGNPAAFTRRHAASR